MARSWAFCDEQGAPSTARCRRSREQWQHRVMPDQEERPPTGEAPPRPRQDGPASLTRQRVEVALVVVLGVPLLLAVLLMAGRVGETARFVTWPVVAFTALSAVVTLVGMRVGLHRPLVLAAGVLPALMLSYVLPAAPLPVVAVVLACLAVLATRSHGLAAGMAMTTGAVMVLSAVAQGPAVQCEESGVSSNSGPWWVPEPSSSSGSSTGSAGGRFSGTTQVGEHRYSYTCAGGRLALFEQADEE